jgi:cobalamin biosynthesis protein CobT
MLLVDDILFAPVRSILWIFREIRDIAQEELDGEAKSITEQLRTLYMQLETGRITEAEFEAGEKLLLDRLDEIESRRSAENGEPEEGDADEESDEDETEESGGLEESDEDETENTDDAGREPDEM